MIFVLIILLLSILLCVLGILDLIRSDKELKAMEKLIKNNEVNNDSKKSIY